MAKIIHRKGRGKVRGKDHGKGRGKISKQMKSRLP
jgi:hypothetical protein